MRSIVRMSIARLVRLPGQHTSSHGVPAMNAVRIVGDQAASAAFRRSTTRAACSRAASSTALA
jgi:hypothetical protein